MRGCGSKIRRRLVLGCLVLASFAGHAFAEAPFTFKDIALYQPSAVLFARVGENAKPLVAYAKDIAAHEYDVFDKAAIHPAVSGAIVMAIKPGLQSRAWLVLGDNTLPPDLAEAVKTRAEAVFPVSVHGGPVAIAIFFDTWGGGRPVTDPKHPLPLPLEWLPMPSQEVVPDGPIARVWP